MVGGIVNARFQQRARAKFGTKGDNPVPTIKELVPVVVMEEFHPEDDFVGGDDLPFTTFAGLGAVVAETFGSVIWNPIGSGVLGIIEYAQGLNTAATTGLFFWTVTDPAGNAGFNVQSLLGRDARMSNDKSLSRLSGFGLKFYSGTLTAAEVGAFPLTATRFPTSLFGWAADTESIIIPEGFGFGYFANVQNIAANSMYSGRQHLQPAGLRS
jgi:hypothetical protein